MTLCDKGQLQWVQSTPLFPQGFQTAQPLAFCGCLAEKGGLQGPFFLIFQQSVPGSIITPNAVEMRLFTGPISYLESSAHVN